MNSGSVDTSKKTGSRAWSKVVEGVVKERDKTFHRPPGPASKKDDPVDGIVRMAAAGVGIVSEAIHHRKEKNLLKQGEQIQQFQQSNDGTAPEQMNEAMWSLDDAEQKSMPKETSPKPSKKPGDLVASFIERHPYQAGGAPKQQLALPVVLTQRRPKKRARGFIRAYAPALSDVNIDQDTFLDFIDTLNLVLEPSEWINAINLVDAVGMAVPDPTGVMGLVSLVAGFVADGAMEGHSRYRGNKYLDVLNSQFFEPRGLVCLVITWRPEAADEGTTTTVDFDGTEKRSTPESNQTQVSKADASQKSLDAFQLHKLQGKMNESIKPSNGAFQWAEIAPLVFPEVNESPETLGKDGKVKKKNAFDRAGKWLDDYTDHDSQARWLEKNSHLPMAKAQPKPEFRSRYADPNHPAASGDLVAFATGGKWQYRKPKPEYSEFSDGRAVSDEHDSMKAEITPTESAQSTAQTEAKNDKESETVKESSQKAEESSEEANELCESKEGADGKTTKESRGIEQEKNREAKKLQEKEAKELKKAKEKEAREAKEIRRAKEKEAKKHKEFQKKREKEAKASGVSSLLQTNTLYLVVMNRPMEPQ